MITPLSSLFVVSHTALNSRQAAASFRGPIDLHTIRHREKLCHTDFPKKSRSSRISKAIVCATVAETGPKPRYEPGNSRRLFEAIYQMQTYFQPPLPKVGDFGESWFGSSQDRSPFTTKVCGVEADKLLTHPGTNIQFVRGVTYA